MLLTMSIILAGALVVLLGWMIYRQLRRKKRKRLSPVQFCENCGKRIKRDERTFYWHGAHVCLDCRKRLGSKDESPSL